MKKLLAILIFMTVSLDVLSQRKQKKKNTNSNQISYEIPDIKWRSIGPYRGGRSATVTGSKSFLFLFLIFIFFLKNLREIRRASSANIFEKS